MKYEVHPQEKNLRIAIYNTIQGLPDHFVLNNERGLFVERVLNTLYEQVRHKSWGTGRLAPDQLENTVRSALYITLIGCVDAHTRVTLSLLDRRDIEDGVILRFMPKPFAADRPDDKSGSLQDAKDYQAWLHQ